MGKMYTICFFYRLKYLQKMMNFQIAHNISAVHWNTTVLQLEYDWNLCWICTGKCWNCTGIAWKSTGKALECYLSNCAMHQSDSSAIPVQFQHFPACFINCWNCTGNCWNCTGIAWKSTGKALECYWSNCVMHQSDSSAIPVQFQHFPACPSGQQTFYGHPWDVRTELKAISFQQQRWRFIRHSENVLQTF